jgi:superfamily II DNA or RNA helicase
MKLWPHQIREHEAVTSALDEHRRICVTAPTGCVSGDTVIGVNRGGKGFSTDIHSMFMSTVSGRLTATIPTMVRSWQDGFGASLYSRIGLVEVKEIVYSGARPTMRLSLENNKTLRATPDHEILTKNGFVRLADLDGRSAILCEGRPQRTKKPKPCYRQVQGLRYHPFANGVVARRQRHGQKPEGRLYRVPLHRLVAEASMNGLDTDELIHICRKRPDRSKNCEFLDPSAFAVHHNDGNHLNNRIDNLQVMTHEEHHRLHGHDGKVTNLPGFETVETLLRNISDHKIEDTFDIKCADPWHNFVANGIVVHNCGKTAMMTQKLEWCGAHGWPALLVTNRRMLFDQTHSVLENHGFDVGKIASGHEQAKLRPIQLAMTQTLARRSWLPEARLVIIDEAHLHKAEQAQKIVKHYIDSGASVIGYTATPLGIRHMYDHLYQACTVSEGRDCGALLPAKVFGPNEVDTRSLEKKKQFHEWSEADCRKLVVPEILFGKIFPHWERLNPEQKPAILFAPGVAESVGFAERFYREGVPAAHIDGENIWWNGEWYKSDPEMRASIKRAAENHDLSIVCNRFVLREGIDWPFLGHMILATPVPSVQAYIQMCGRLLRNYEGMDSVTLVDHGGCLDEHTEILTQRGWLGIDDISDTDVIGTMCLETEAFNWCENEGTLIKRRDSFMKAIQAPHLDFRVTDYHEMVMRADLRGGQWKKQKAGELFNRKSNWIIPTSCIEHIVPCEVTDDEIRFIGWYLTDGCLDSARIRIYQSGNAPKEHHDSIVSCIEGCGFRYTRRTRRRTTPFGQEPTTEVTYSVSSGRKSERGWDHLSPWIDKAFPCEVFDALDRRQFGVLLAAMNLGDGLKHSTYNQRTQSIAVARKEVADRIQSLAVRRGYRCNVATQAPLDGQPIYILHIRDSQMATVAKGAMRNDYIGVDERVWCVQTANGTLITRRNGKIAIMGNSWWRHGSPNADRDWDLGLTDGLAYMLRRDRIRSDKEKEPLSCPGCGMITMRINGECSHCGYRITVRSRIVIQTDGQLDELTGRIFRDRKRRASPNTASIWESMYYRSHRSRNKMTFAQAEGLFFKENFYWPTRDLPLMPKTALDWHRRVCEVPRSELISKPIGEPVVERQETFI